MKIRPPTYAQGDIDPSDILQQPLSAETRLLCERAWLYLHSTRATLRDAQVAMAVRVLLMKAGRHVLDNHEWRLLAHLFGNPAEIPAEILRDASEDVLVLRAYYAQGNAWRFSLVGEQQALISEELPSERKQPAQAGVLHTQPTFGGEVALIAISFACGVALTLLVRWVLE